MPNPYLLLAVLLALAGSGLGGYRMGWRAAEGEHALQRQHDIIATWQAGRAELAAESERAQQAERARDRLSQRLREIDHADPPPPRPDCRWTQLERLRLDERRAAYLADDPDAPAGALPGAVPGDAGDPARPAGDRPAAPGLGLRLPGAAAPVPGLGAEPRP